MATFTITAKPRQLMGRKNRQLRAESRIPAVVYGFGVEPQNLELDRNEFVKLYNAAGESSVVDLVVDGGETISVLVQDFQRDPITGFVTHADFRAIDMTQPIDTEVKFIFEGESMAVKSMGGTLVKNIDGLQIRCLPKDLLTSLSVDLSKLETFDDAIRVADLDLPDSVEVMEDPERTVAVVAPPRSEEEMAALDEAIEGDIAEVEVEGEKKEEGAEGAEAPQSEADQPKAEAEEKK